KMAAEDGEFAEARFPRRLSTGNPAFGTAPLKERRVGLIGLLGGGVERVRDRVDVFPNSAFDLVERRAEAWVFSDKRGFGPEQPRERLRRPRNKRGGEDVRHTGAEIGLPGEKRNGTVSLRTHRVPIPDVARFRIALAVAVADDEGVEQVRRDGQHRRY